MPLRPLIVAHRGASADATENTLAAFRLAWEQNADAIEGDFHLTGDGQVVCHHDASLGRLFPGKQAIHDLTLAEVMHASAGQIPTLAEFLGTIPVGKGAFLELKTGPEIVAPLAREVATFDRLWDARLTLMSFFPATVRAARAAFPGSLVNWLVDLADIDDPVAIARSARELRVDGLGLSRSPMIDAAFLKPLLRAGFPVHLWTVDDPVEARRFAGLGITSLTTNRPGMLRAALAEGPFSP